MTFLFGFLWTPHGLAVFFSQILLFTQGPKTVEENSLGLEKNIFPVVKGKLSSV